ncbi:mediator of RNA polymerase II transcription subunit 15a-like isoform X3 [Carya illinoinensis]|uniref:mediator of RNA polymerase II transcription subunit 15a-like isoform X3 n=1 Tax=Carya illinoinensis TaxID=32201 RepID=UPI001C723BB2|nr:mediator of RNA polymerase II transcription subunit 15a-like isoform X3 [Carya illinoinensis]
MRMDTLKRHLPVSGQEGLHELRKIAIRFEEKIYTAATSQGDYLRKISLKMLTMETKSQNPTTNSLPSNSAGNSNKPPDSGMLGMQNQVHNQGQSLPIPLQSQARQQLLSQNIQNNVPSAGVQSSTSLPSTLPTVSGLNQAPISNVVGQNTNMQNISGNSQNPVGNSMGQGVPSNMFTNNQRQMQGRQQVVPLQQQQQQSQNQQQYMYQQQLQQKLLKQKIQQGNTPHALMQVQSHIQQQQQQQQQNLLQNNQLQSSQQSIMQSSSGMQPSVMQSSSLSVLQQNQQPSIQQATQNMLQQHSQSVLRQPQQAAVVHPQQTQLRQQSILPTQQQQQQQLMGQQPNATNMQQNQLIAQPSSVGDMQQQQQRLLGQQNNLQNMQQQQQQQQQHQLMAQQNNLSNMHQQLGSQSNVSGLQQQQQQQQQQQLLGAQSVNSSMQTSQHPVHMLQQSKVPVQQQSQHNAANFLPTQGQLSQSQPQPPQQQLMSQIQSQPSQLQQQLGLQQQTNTLQRDMQQRLQASGQVSGPLLQPQNVIDQQKQFYQRAVPDTSSTSLDSTAQTGHGNGGDWQEEVYQKIKAMKEMHLPELNEMYQKIAAKVQQQDSLSQQPKSDQLEKLKTFKTMLERLITFLQVSKDNIVLQYKDKLGLYEKQILNFINTNRPRKPVSSLQQGQLPPPHMHSMQQSQSQITQMQSHESQMNPQLQSMNLQGSVATMQQNNMTSLQHNSLSLSGVSTAQQNMMNSLQSGSNMDSGQGNAPSSLQPVAMGSLQQNPVSAPQQTNVNNLSSQSGVNALQPTINSLQSSSNMLQQQHLKQHQEQQMMQQTQQLKQQYQQRQMQQHLMQKQHLMQQQQQQQQQQLHQQPKQQMSAQLQSQQIPQLHQTNDANELKIRPGLGVKPGVFQQHLPAGQRAAYPHQQLKPGASFPTSSPQLLQAVSPQILQHSSPQVDQQNVLASITKAGTPLQSANSPFVVPSPSTPLAPSPMPGDSEKPISGVSSLSNAGNIGHQQTSGVGAPAPSLAIGTPGISASPLLAEFTGQEGTHGNALMNVSGKSSITEQPLERLIKAVKSMSPKSLSASVSDIGSVVSMIDRIAGSAPGNGSRAAVGEDLVAMTKCRLQARNFIIQDGSNGMRKMRRYTSAMPLNVVSSAGSMNDSFKQLSGSETSELESTATSSVKRPRIEVNHALLEEIREINQGLIDTVVDISDEDVDPTAGAAAAEGGEGTIVKCSFNAVALSPNLKSQYTSAQMSPIQPLRLLVPSNYPNCSPILLDKFPVEVSKDYEDLSVKAKSRFSISLRNLSQPMSLGQIARTWDVCARAIISEHAQQSGGGSFSSKYGTWENCLSAT